MPFLKLGKMLTPDALKELPERCPLCNMPIRQLGAMFGLSMVEAHARMHVRDRIDHMGQALCNLLEAAERVASGEAPVLILGPACAAFREAFDIPIARDKEGVN